MVTKEARLKVTTKVHTIPWLAAALLAACGGEENESLSFGEDMQRAEAPQLAALPVPAQWWVDPPVYNAAQLERQHEGERYVAERYREQGWRIVETTQTYLGDILDWIDPASIRGSDAPRPPPIPPEQLKPPPGAQLQQTELDVYPELRGPKGTVPVVRPNFAPYVRGEVRAASIEDYLALPQVAGRTRLYAGLYSTTPCKSVSSWVNDFGDAVQSGTFSVIETAVVCPGTNPSTTMELVGAATSRDPKHFGNSILRLQFEFATQGDLTKDDIGGWHGTVYGFVLASDAPYSNGIALTPVSTVGGIQYTSRFIITQVGSNWWIGHNGNWLGFYEGSKFDMLNSYGCQAHWYGEVYDETPTDWTLTNMGSGRHASGGFGQAAYVMTPFYVDLAGVSRWPAGGNYSSPQDSACYTRSPLFTEPPGQDRYFFLGGPGGDAIGCN
jgi:hypothetical protein